MSVQPDPEVKTTGWHHAAVAAAKRREEFIDAVASGLSIRDTLRELNINRATYEKWRSRYPKFKARIDAARSIPVDDGVETGEAPDIGQRWAGSSADFAERYFSLRYSWFHLLFLEEFERMPPGNILMCLFPPEHGKTTMFENIVCEKFARQPDYRVTVASESQPISRKILARVRNRLEPDGPFPKFVNQWGPFVPQTGEGRKPAQPWGADYFTIYKKTTVDERDYSMVALGRNSSIVSTRTDHLHADDLQSTKTANQTNQIEEWLRQDAFTRPGEHGKTTIAGTRVGDDDIYERLENDPDMDGIIKVLKFPAIITDHVTGSVRPLFPERYSLDQLDRMRRKVGQEAWDRNYMQQPGVSDVNRTFDNELIEQCLDSERSLLHAVDDDNVIYVGLDPALGGKNCVLAAEVLPEGKMVVRWIREDSGFTRNEQIMESLADVVTKMTTRGGRVTDVVVESMNFQKGLARDERLLDMRTFFGFALREHLTGWNKYDENIGIPSMAESFRRKEIILPWADDDLTRLEIGELVRQLKAWKPGQRGSKHRMDRIMALWFVWILWRSRWKSADSQVNNPQSWRRSGVPYTKTNTGLIIPVGARI
jgi:hypothetical protein